MLTLVELRHGFESDDIGRRFELMDDQMLEVVADICVVEAEGDGPLAQLMTWCWWATSCRSTWPPTPGSTPAPSRRSTP